MKTTFTFKFSRKKEKPINLYQYAFTGKNDRREIMKGVFHDKEYQCAVATDGHILVASKKMYDSAIGENEKGSVVMKDGSIFQGKAPYPNYRSAIGWAKGFIDKHGCHEFQLADDDMKNIVRAVKEDKASLGGKKIGDEYYLVCLASSSFPYTQIVKFSKACEKICVCDNPENTAVYFSDDIEALLMPTRYSRQKLADREARLVGQFGEMSLYSVYE